MRIRVMLIGLTAILAATGAFAQAIPGGQLITQDILVTIPEADYAKDDYPPCHSKDMNNPAQLASGLAAAKFLTTPNPALQIIASFASQFIYVVIAQGQDWVRKQGGTGGMWLVPDRYATCVAVTFDKQKYPQYKQFASRVWMREQGPNNFLKPCKEGAGDWTKCEVGWAAVQQTDDGSVITYIIKNWSHNRTREARVDFYGYEQAGACPTHLSNDTGNLGVHCSR
jgi:hypothetical protein